MSQFNQREGGTNFYTGADERVTDTIKFSAEKQCTLDAPGIPDRYKQSRPERWKIDDEMEQRQSEDSGETELVVTEDGGRQVNYKRKETPIALAGVVLDTGKYIPQPIPIIILTLYLGPTGDVRILLK